MPSDDTDMEKLSSSCLYLLDSSVSSFCYQLCLWTLARGVQSVANRSYQQTESESACLWYIVHELDENFLDNSGASFASIEASF